MDDFGTNSKTSGKCFWGNCGQGNCFILKGKKKISVGIEV